MFVPRTAPLPRSTAAPDPRSPPHPTKCDRYRQNAKASPSTDTMRQITTKTPLPCSHPRPTQCDSYRQNIRSHSLHLDRHNATVIDKTPKPRTPLDRHNTTDIDKTPKPSSPLVRHNATDIDKNAIVVLSPSTDTIRQISTNIPKPHSPPRPT